MLFGLAYFLVAVLAKPFRAGKIVFVHKPDIMQYSLQHFKKLPVEKQLEQLTLSATHLDLDHCTGGAEAVLFTYGDFYVELIVEKYSDAVLSVNCFRSTRKLAPYLQRINISEITALLSCSN